MATSIPPGPTKPPATSDSYYVSALPATPRAPGPTPVATIGMFDISLDRTVALPAGQRRDRWHELRPYVRSRPRIRPQRGRHHLPAARSTCPEAHHGGCLHRRRWRPGAEVDEQTLDTLTFGVGARLQTVVGESMYNRTSILEARIMAKADAGDRSGSEGRVTFRSCRITGSVDSVERGALGLEVTLYHHPAGSGKRQHLHGCLRRAAQRLHQRERHSGLSHQFR